MTPATIAAGRGHAECIDAIALLGGAETLTLATKHKWTPAHFAARDGHAECLKALAKRGAASTMTALTDDGLTPAHLAAYNNQAECIDALASCTLGAVATLTRVHPKRGTPAHVAASKGHLESLKSLHKALKRVADNDRKAMSQLWSKLRLGDAELDAARAAFEERLRTQSRLAVPHKVKGHPQPSTPAEVAARAGHAECASFLSSI